MREKRIRHDIDLMFYELNNDYKIDVFERIVKEFQKDRPGSNWKFIGLHRGYLTIEKSFKGKQIRHEIDVNPSLHYTRSGVKNENPTKNKRSILTLSQIINNYKLSFDKIYTYIEYLSFKQM